MVSTNKDDSFTNDKPATAQSICLSAASADASACIFNECSNDAIIAAGGGVLCTAEQAGCYAEYPLCYIWSNCPDCNKQFNDCMKPFIKNCMDECNDKMRDDVDACLKKGNNACVTAMSDETHGAGAVKALEDAECELACNLLSTTMGTASGAYDVVWKEIVDQLCPSACGPIVKEFDKDSPIGNANLLCGTIYNK